MTGKGIPGRTLRTGYGEVPRQEYATMGGPTEFHAGVKSGPPGASTTPIEDFGRATRPLECLVIRLLARQRKTGHRPIQNVVHQPPGVTLARRGMAEVDPRSARLFDSRHSWGSATEMDPTPFPPQSRRVGPPSCYMAARVRPTAWLDWSLSFCPSWSR